MVVFKESWIVIASNLLPEVIDLEKHMKGGEMYEKGAPTDRERDFIDKQDVNIGAFNVRVKKFRFDIAYEEDVKEFPFDALSVAVILKEFVSQLEQGKTLEFTSRINPTKAGSTVEPVGSGSHSERCAPTPTPYTLDAYENMGYLNRNLQNKVGEMQRTIDTLEARVNTEMNRADIAESRLRQWIREREQDI